MDADTARRIARAAVRQVYAEKRIANLQRLLARAYQGVENRDRLLERYGARLDDLGVKPWDRIP